MASLVLLFIITGNLFLFDSSQQTEILSKCLQPVPIRPNQIRLSFIPTGMVISWQTFGVVPHGSNPNIQPAVSYGLSSKSLTSRSTDGDWSVYDTRDPLYTSYFYNVKLLNLMASTTYYYKIAESTCAYESAIYYFRTAPVIGDLNRPINITILGDLGAEFLLCNGDCRRTMNALQQIVNSTDFFIHSGDFAYADDTPLTYELTYNNWQNDMTSVTSIRAYMTAVGNHEASCSQIDGAYCPGQQRNFSAYFHRFRMPGLESGGFSNMWWSHDYGMVHVIAIDTETDFPNAPSGSANTNPTNGNFQNNTAQLTWLRADLEKAKANRDKVPWILVTGHRLWYGTTSLQNVLTNAIINCPQCKQAFEPLFNEYNVDFYIAGHVHWYERFCPQGINCVNNTNVYRNPQGPIYMLNGAAGNPEGISTPIKNSTPTNSVKLITKAGFAQILFQNRNEAIWNYYLSTNPDVPEDSVYIIKAH